MRKTIRLLHRVKMVVRQHARVYAQLRAVEVAQADAWMDALAVQVHAKTRAESLVGMVRHVTIVAVALVT